LPHLAAPFRGVLKVATAELSGSWVILGTRSKRGERLASVSERSAMAVEDLDEIAT
jgi:hypothetical protein